LAHFDSGVNFLQKKMLLQHTLEPQPTSKIVRLEFSKAETGKVVKEAQTAKGDLSHDKRNDFQKQVKFSTAEFHHEASND
jgi:hypothetical protein